MRPFCSLQQGLVEWLRACKKQLLKYELGCRFYFILIHLNVHLVSVAVGTAHRYTCHGWEQDSGLQIPHMQFSESLVLVAQQVCVLAGVGFVTLYFQFLTA